MTSKNKIQTPIQLLKQLATEHDTLSDHEVYQFTRNLLVNVFDKYTVKNAPFSSIDERKEAADLLIKSLPAIHRGLRVFHIGFNADKRVGAQKYLSSLQFLLDDLKTDNPDLKDKIEAFFNSDLMEDIKEDVENTRESQTWGPVEPPPMVHVPRSHSWWDWD